MSETPTHNRGDEPRPRGEDAASDPLASQPPAAAERDSGRDASVTLRRTSSRPATTSELMDQANRSLAESLRFAYLCILGAAALLGAAYVFSGFRTVNEGEAGVKLLFGATTTASAVEPGITFTWPYPFGELVKIETGSVPVRIDDAFWGRTLPGQSPGNPDGLVKQGQLDPIENGSVITADQNLAHTYWTADYRRDDPTRFAASINPDDESAIVEAVLQRAVVLAVAEEPIEDLLRPTAEGTGLESRVRSAAQSMLDRMGRGAAGGGPTPSGIEIERVTLQSKVPPAALLERFRAVQSARSEAARLQTDARSERSQRLNEVAGGAGQAMLGLIDEYERAIELGGADRAAEVLAAIDDIIEGREAALDEQDFPPELIGGQITEIIATAENDRFELREQAAADLELFNAKLQQFRANPSLMVARDWSRAYSEFLSKEFVTVMMLPEGRRAEIRINDHPQAARAAELRTKRRQAQEAAIERERFRRMQRFRTEEGIQEEAPPNAPGGGG